MGSANILIIFAMLIVGSGAHLYSPGDENIDFSESIKKDAEATFFAAINAAACLGHNESWAAKPFEPVRMQAFYRTSFYNAFDAEAEEFLMSLPSYQSAKSTPAAIMTEMKWTVVCHATGQQTKTPFSANCGQAQTDFPDHYSDTEIICNSNASGGVADVDFIVYVSAENNPGCSSNVLATASVCLQRQPDNRPIAGSVNVCPNKVEVKKWNVNATVATMKHELLHTLVLSSNLYNDFYYPPGRKRGRSVTNINRKWQINPNYTHMHTPHLITSPAVKWFVREYFKCADLEGAELENEGGVSTARSHWEKRLFGPEIMTGVLSRKSYFSNLTLYLMEDSGWYKVRMDMATPMYYGKGRGCIFAKQSCREFMDTQPNKTKAADPYCNWFDYVERETQNSTTRSCSGDRSYITFCHWNKTAKNDKTHKVKPEFLYFDDKTVDDYSAYHVYGNQHMTDGCPAWSDIFYGEEDDEQKRMPYWRHGDSICANKGSQPLSSANWGVEIYGEHSICMLHDGKFEAFRCGMAGMFSPSSESGHGAGCYEYKCHEGRLFIRANFMDREDNKVLSSWRICLSNQSTVTIRRPHPSGSKNATRFHKGIIQCPSCEELCSTESFTCEPPLRIDSMDSMNDPCRGVQLAVLKMLYMAQFLVLLIFE